MNKKIIIILSGAIIVLLISSIIFGIKCFQYKRIINDFYSVNESEDYTGIYQTQYYNTYNKSMTLIIRLNKDNTCYYGESITERASNGDVSNCTYEINDNKLKIIMDFELEREKYSGIEVENKHVIRRAEFLNESTLFYSGKQLYKIS